jgi:hypothetical protein
MTRKPSTRASGIPRSTCIGTPTRGRNTKGGTQAEMRTLVAIAPLLEEELYEVTHERPRTRGECRGGIRPCPYVACRHHLAIEVTDVGRLKLVWPGRELEDMPATCALDLVDEADDGATLDEIGAALNVTRERVRQIERKALAKFRARMRALGVTEQELRELTGGSR